MRQRGNHGKPEIFIFNGLKYRRYPQSKNRSLRVYFSRRGGVHLHREIWKSVHGKIPKGHHIHHKDENPLNNAIENLECISAGDHLRHHRLGKIPTEEQTKHLERIRPMAAEWHRSDEGRAWHSQHSIDAFAGRKPIKYKCEQCGKEFESKKIGGVRFCHINCKSTARKRSGIDNVERKCLQCGKEFIINKYVKKDVCSSGCCRSRKAQQENSGVQSDG